MKWLLVTCFDYIGWLHIFYRSQLFYTNKYMGSYATEDKYKLRMFIAV